MGVVRYAPDLSVATYGVDALRASVRRDYWNAY